MWRRDNSNEREKHCWFAWIVLYFVFVVDHSLSLSLPTHTHTHTQWDEMKTLERWTCKRNKSTAKKTKRKPNELVVPCWRKKVIETRVQSLERRTDPNARFLPHRCQWLWWKRDDTTYNDDRGRALSPRWICEYRQRVSASILGLSIDEHQSEYSRSWIDHSTRCASSWVMCRKKLTGWVRNKSQQSKSLGGEQKRQSEEETERERAVEI